MAIVTLKPSRKRHALKRERHQDPFHILGNIPISLVIAALPVWDTETLRRVSKLWKATSEFHCSKGAVLKRFPWAATRASRCQSIAEASLLFRRCLYYEASLVLGHATRAMRFNGVRSWDIRNDTIYWAGYVMKDGAMRSLRSPGGTIVMSPEDTEVPIEDIMSSEVERIHGDVDRSHFVPGVPAIQIISRTEILVSLGMCSNSDGSTAMKFTKIIKMTMDGKVVWNIDIMSSVSKAIIGKDAVYLLCGRSESQDDYNWIFDAVFKKLSLLDGSTMVELPIKVGKVMGETLQLSDDESLVTFEGLDVSYVFALSSPTHTIYRILNPGLPQHQGTPTSTGCDLWMSGSHSASRTIFDGQSRDYVSIEYPYMICDTSLIPPIRKYDKNHEVFYQILHEQGELLQARQDAAGNETLDPFAAFAIMPTKISNSSRRMTIDNRPPRKLIRELRPAAIVNLPDKSQGKQKWRALDVECWKSSDWRMPREAWTLQKRRPLQLEMPFKLDKKDFFGMKDDYLIFNSPRHDMLILVDFWPTW